MLAEKIFLGVALAAPIGPVSIEMIRRGLHCGGRAAFIVRLGALFGNALCLIAATIGLGFLSQESMLLKCLSMLGAAYLMYMGVKAIYHNKHFQTTNPEKNQSNALVVGMILSIANPVAFAFWLGIFATSMLQSNTTSAYAHLLPNSLILVGVLLWGALLSIFLEIGSRYLTKSLVQKISICSGICLLYFGSKYIIQAIGSFL